jgi:hypothetical protein
MAYLGIGTISVGSTETGFTQTVAIGATMMMVSVGSTETGFTQTVSAIGATMMMVSVGSTETGFTQTIGIVGLNTNASISIANSTTAYSAPFILNSGVTETIQISGILSTVSYGSTEIDRSTMLPIWKISIFVGVGTTGGGVVVRPSVGQVFPRGL